MPFVTCALVPRVPEEGSRPCAAFAAHQRTDGSLKNSGTRGGGPWDRRAKDRLPDSAFPIFGGADAVPEVRPSEHPEAARQNQVLPTLRTSPDLPVSTLARGAVMTNTPDPIDVHVGAAIRDRRIALGKNQSQLAKALGVTFQQVQKYEKGTNRVSSSMLWRAAAALNVKPGDFFPVGDWMAAGTVVPMISRTGMGAVTRDLAGMSEARFNTARKVIRELAGEGAADEPMAVAA